jgi:predicted nucleotidyltransferase
MTVVVDFLPREVTRRLVKQFQPEEIILFGSHAWGIPTTASDLDLMVIVTHTDLSDYERSLQGHRCLAGLNIAKDIVMRTGRNMSHLNKCAPPWSTGSPWRDRYCMTGATASAALFDLLRHPVGQTGVDYHRGQ